MLHPYGMRIRTPFAGAFFALLLAAAYLGLAPNPIPTYNQSDKAFHVVGFFLLTLCFYWVIETTRRRTLHLTLLVCSGALAVGSEVLQGLLPNGRDFDPYDILANEFGSLGAVALCTWYHKRMLERKRQAKNYQVVPGEDLDQRDLELGEGVGAQRAESAADAGPTIEEEVDNWDENALDDEGDENENENTATTINDHKDASS